VRIQPRENIEEGWRTPLGFRYSYETIAANSVAGPLAASDIGWGAEYHPHLL
jgi:hypothetical protein